MTAALRVAALPALALLCLTGFVVGGAPAAAATAAAGPGRSSQDLETALDHGDIVALRAISADAGRPRRQAELARGALAAWLRQDQIAVPALTRSAQDQSLPRELRAAASVVLAGVRLRQGRYAEAAARIDAALPDVADAAARADLRQSRAFAAALAGVAPMRAEVGGQGAIPLTRDLAGLNRGVVTVNGGRLDAIIDTGSAVSTITEGHARELGLHLLESEVSVGTATSASARAKLAVADHVSIGPATFRDVVFLVLPDKSLTFGDGAYVVNAIIGLPLLLELGRIQFSTAAGAETMSFDRTGAHPSAASNLTLDGDQAYTFARIAGSTTPVRLFIDNGAKSGHLNLRFAADFPAAAKGAIRRSVSVTGGAGAETQQAMTLPTLVLSFGSTEVALTDVDVVDDHHPNDHGAIGLDALRTAPVYVLDFEAMRFELGAGG